MQWKRLDEHTEWAVGEISLWLKATARPRPGMAVGGPTAGHHPSRRPQATASRTEKDARKSL